MMIDEIFNGLIQFVYKIKTPVQKIKYVMIHIQNVKNFLFCMPGYTVFDLLG